jgi:lysophospholipase L1-like esterase
MRTFPVQPALTILTLAAMLSGAHLLLPAIHGPVPTQFAAIAQFPPLLSPLVRHIEPALPAVPAPSLKPAALPQFFEDASPALDHFYASLWRTEKKAPNAVTRIVHYGDSPSTADLITGDVRSILQTQYGDAGHGFVLIGKPWAWYRHNGVELSASGWKMSRASFAEAHDGLFGLGGVSFLGNTGASSKIVYSSPGHTHFEVWYLKEPGGGSLHVMGDGEPLGDFETGADEKAPAVAVFDTPAEVHTLELKVVRSAVRLFGVVAEKSGPGVVYDTLGLNGASVSVLSHLMNAQHLTDELRQRNPDLVIVNYGTNEADFASYVDKGYEKELREAIRRIRAALPETSILLMSPMDRGQHSGAGIETMPTIPRLVEIQRRVARETGCGFFDTFDAMGGEGTMARWYTSQPRLVSADLIHPFPAGGKSIAVIFARELSAGLERYKLCHVR